MNCPTCDRPQAASLPAKAGECARKAARAVYYLAPLGDDDAKRVAFGDAQVDCEANEVCWPAVAADLRERLRLSEEARRAAQDDASRLGIERSEWRERAEAAEKRAPGQEAQIVRLREALTEARERVGHCPCGSEACAPAAEVVARINDALDATEGGLAWMRAHDAETKAAVLSEARDAILALHKDHEDDAIENTIVDCADALDALAAKGGAAPASGPVCEACGGPVPIVAPPGCECGGTLCGRCCTSIHGPRKAKGGAR